MTHKCVQKTQCHINLLIYSSKPITIARWHICIIKPQKYKMPTDCACEIKKWDYA